MNQTDPVLEFTVNHSWSQHSGFQLTVMCITYMMFLLLCWSFKPSGFNIWKIMEKYNYSKHLLVLHKRN